MTYDFSFHGSNGFTGIPNNSLGGFSDGLQDPDVFGRGSVTPLSSQIGGHQSLGYSQHVRDSYVYAYHSIPAS